MQRRAALRRLTHSTAAAAATLAWPAFAQTRGIVLGQSAAFTGPAAQLGVQMHRGAKIHFDMLTASGGINGQTVELRTLDDGYEPDRCKVNTERFIKSGDVFGLFGYVGTPTCMAALPLVNDARIPFFGPFTGAEALRDPFSRYVFHVRASYFDETALIVRHLTNLGLTKIAVFYQNDSYGQAGLAGMKRALTQRKLEPIALGTVERNTVDVAKAVADILPRMPEAIVQISAYKSCAAFIRAARKAGYGAMFINVSFVGTQALADELGKEARGVMVSQVMPYPFSTTTAISREYLDAVRKAGPDVQPNYSSMEGFVAAKVMAEGLRRAGRNPSRDALIASLESIRGTSFGGFNVDFSAQRHVASNFVDLSVLTEDGKVLR
jgi:ABC-type branched-subunit amino acid transport system substrate-binding protein